MHKLALHGEAGRSPFSLSLRRWRDSRQRVTAALRQELQALLTRAGKLLVGRTRCKSGRELGVLLEGLDKDAPVSDVYQEVALRVLVGQRNVVVPPNTRPLSMSLSVMAAHTLSV